MIRRIDIDGEKITLVPAEVVKNPRLNIFSADSMTLIVGPNGSGKTRLLVKIAEAVMQGELLSVDATKPLDDVEVVYLTLSNFGKPPFSRRYNRLQVLQRSRANEKLTSDEETIKALRLFGKVPRYAVNLLGTEKLGLAAIMGELTKVRSLKQIEDEHLRSRLLKLRDLEKERIGQQEKVSSEDDSWFDSSLYKEIKHTFHDAEKIVVSILQSRISINGFRRPEALFLRAVSIVSKRTKSREFIRSVLDDIRILNARNSGASKRGHVQDLRRTERNLREVGQILGEDSLSKDEYTISTNVAAALNAANVADVSRISIKGASSGMAALVSQFAMIKEAIEKVKTNGTGSRSLLLLIDEGDVFLHLAWQQKYIAFLDKFLKDACQELESVQVVITTHSPVLMSDFPRDCIHKLGHANQAVDQGGAISFGAQLVDVVRYTGDAGTMGVFAHDTLKRWFKKIERNQRIDSYHLDLIDDPVIRRLFSNALGEPQT